MFKRLRAMRDHGYRVSIITGRDCNPAPDWDLNGIEVLRVPCLVKYIDPARDLKALWTLIRLLRHIRPDAVHTHLAKAGILGRWAAWLSRTPFILHTVHGPTFPATLPAHKRMPYLWMERIAGRITDWFVFVGEEVRVEYTQAGVCGHMNSVIVRTGRPDAEIEAAARATEAERDDMRGSLLNGNHRFLIACVGRIVPSKQQDHALRVLHRLRQMGVDAGLVIVGEGYVREETGYLGRLERIAQDLGVIDHICFTGHRDDALKIMSASDAILHTSKYEGLPNIMVEAAIVSKPIVAYEVSGAREVVRDGRTGFILAQEDIDGAAEKLALLAADPERSKRMGALANATVSAEYRESTMIRNKLAFYDRIFERDQRTGDGRQ